MQNLFTDLFDIVFPPSDDMLRVRTITLDKVGLYFAERSTDGIISLCSYTNEDVRALIHETKFHGSRKATKLLAHVLETYFNEKTHAYDVIVPIPLSPVRKRERGFNQVEEILHETKTSISISATALKRIRHTIPQASLKREERFQNMKNVFSVKKPETIKNKRVLVIDDVTTTGATLRSARSELMKHNPASVTLLALAH